MIISNNNFSSIEQMAHKLSSNGRYERRSENDFNLSFLEVLQQQTNISEPIKFSKHASERLNNRNISLTNAQVKRLEDGAQKAREKGVKESLVCVDNYAFIVNVKNNIVVTALSGDDEKVFTNIDGAVIM